MQQKKMTQGDLCKRPEKTDECVQNKRESLISGWKKERKKERKITKR